jgi:outer membrane protein assembly factor BamB
MNDEQLIRLLQEKTPEELSLEEIDLLRRRLAESDELRQTLFEQLEMEQYLAEALGRVEVSTDKIIAKSPQRTASNGHPMLLTLAVLVCLGLAGFIATLLVMGISGSGERPVVKDTGDAKDDPKPPDKDPAENTQTDSNPNPPQPQGSDSGDGDEETEPDTGTTTQPPKVPEPEPPPKVVGPWTAGLDAPPQAFAAVWPLDFETSKSVPSQQDLADWFTDVPGQPKRFYEDQVGNIRYGAIDGVLKLKAPWPNDAALKFSTAKQTPYRIHVFSGDRGVSIYSYVNAGPTIDHWAAFVTTRSGDKPIPDSLALASTSDGRDQVTEARYGPTLLLRWHDGDIVLTRGDVEMARAPLAAPPEAVYFQGQLVFRGIDMMRLKDVPPTPQPLPVVAQIDKPEALEWSQQTPENSKFEKLPDGGVKLSANRVKTVAFAAVPLPEGTPHVIDVLLEDISPGTAIYLGNPEIKDGTGNLVEPAGRPANEVLSFLENRRDKRLSASWAHFYNNWRDNDFGPVDDHLVPVIGKSTWVRFVMGAGFIHCSVSPDGTHWAHLYRPANEFLGPKTHLGIVCSVESPDCQLTLRKVVVRKLPVLTALAGDDAMQKAIPVADKTLAQWLPEVMAALPADVDPDAWRFACALKTIAAGAPAPVSQTLLDRVLEDPCVKALPWEEQLKLLDEAAMLVNPWQALPGDRAFDLPARYIRLALAASEAGNARPQSLVRQRLMTSPTAIRGQFKALDSELVRREILSLAYSGKWDEQRDFNNRLLFYSGNLDILRNLSPLAEWARLSAVRHEPGQVGAGVTRLRNDWQHPLVEQYSKEAYNVMAEFHAAVESQSYEDAAKIIASLDPYGTSGLLPSAVDRQLLVSVPTAVAAAMQQDAKLADVMNRQFAPLGRLRVKQAIATGDEASVQLATIQFQGTAAAGEAQRWLGDRSLASGEFLQAIAHYRRAVEQGGASQKPQALPRMRLAAAMLGHDFGERITAPVQLGEKQLSADQFEALVAEMRTAHAGSAQPLNIEGAATAKLTSAVKPSGFQVNRRARLDGEPGEGPNQLNGHVRQLNVPWLERQLGLTIQGNILYVNNRFHVAAYDLANNGNRQWQSPPPPERGQTHSWMLTAMKPLVVGDRIYVRQLHRNGPVLVCLDRNNGQHVWVTPAPRDEEIVSDPLISHGKLLALTLLRTHRDDGLLRLTSFALDTGEVIDSSELVGLRDSWRQWRVCAMTQTEDGVIASLGGLVLCTDLAGNVRWARRQVPLPASQEPTWVAQRFDEPLVDGNRVFVAGPGVRTVECLDARSGRLLWQSVLPAVDRLIGLAGEKLIVHVGEEVLGLDAGTGKISWRAKMPPLYDAELCGGQHGVLLAQRVPHPTAANQFCPQFIWLKPDTGEATSRFALADLGAPDPRFGPLLLHNDKPWTFFGNGPDDPHRDLVELVPQGEASPPQVAASPGDPWVLNIPPEVRASSDKLFPQWRLLATANYGAIGAVPDAHGEKDALAFSANAASPVVFARQVSIPPDGQPRLSLRLGHEPGHNHRLVVRLGQKIVHEENFEWAKTPQVWSDINVDLKPVAGQSGWLLVEVHFTGLGDQARTYWKKLDMAF